MEQRDPKGVLVQVDSYIHGFMGFSGKSAKGRVTHVSPWGWVTAWDPDRETQFISYPGKFLVKGEPRPLKMRRDIPERFQA